MPLFGRPKGPTGLHGRWYGRVADESVAVEFRPDGQLAWVILTQEGTRQTILMTYRVEGDCIVTNQPSAPNEERTTYSLDASGLTLEFGGVKTHLTR